MNDLTYLVNSNIFILRGNKSLNEEMMRTEGDINLSEVREDWKARNLNEETLDLLKEDETYFLHQSLSTPCLNVIEKSHGIYLEDINGKKYMDFHGNSVHQIGYGNEYVINAIKKELEHLPFSPRRYTNKIAIALAKKLSGLTGDRLSKMLFAPGGTSAVSMALKLARKATGKFKTIAMWDAFHGASLDAISVGGETLFRKDMGPLLPETIHILPYNSYRSVLSMEDNLNYLEYVLQREPDVGAMILEPMRCTDVQIPPQSYHQRIRALCDKYGVLLIFDEIPTAFGRTGKMFSYQNYGIEPDILLLGKGLGGGVFPMGAMLARADLDVANDIALGHFTHEKSSLGCAAALATIEYIEKENLLDHVAKLEQMMRERLNHMQAKYEIIGDVRGIGLLFGVELVRDKETKEKAITETEKIMYACMDRGVSFKVSGGNILTLTPPLIISEAELMKAMDIVEAAIQEVL